MFALNELSNRLREDRQGGYLAPGKFLHQGVITDLRLLRRRVKSKMVQKRMDEILASARPPQ